MGCDIHGHVEFKKDGVWHNWSTVDIDRNYDLFAKMANVRNDGTVEPVADPRGVPMDISMEVAMDINQWDCDGHSHSWLSGPEMEAVKKWAEEKWPDFQNQYWKLFGFLFGNYPWDYVRPDLDPYYKKLSIEDVRLIFWFDY